MPESIKTLPLDHQLEIIINYLSDAIATADNINLIDLANSLDSMQEDLQDLQEQL